MDLLKIRLSKRNIEIELPSNLLEIETLISEMPKVLEENLDKITINDLKKICDAWGILRRGKSKIEDLRNCLIDHFSKHEPKPLGISLFAGAGGDSLGMENAGVNVIGFVEKDPIATRTHLKNFKNSVHIGSDITKIPNSEFAKYLGKIEYLFGGFPCQSFSHGGKKDPRDPRGQLYVDFVRATECIQPKWVIGENVKGILARVNTDGECMADVVVEAFKKIGYAMKYKLINASNFGVPQSRERVIFIGYKILDASSLNLEDPENLKIPIGNSQLSKLRDILEFSMEDAMTMPARVIEKVPRDKFIVGGDDNTLPTGQPPSNLVKCSEHKSNKDDITYKTRGESTYSCIVDINDVSRTLLCAYAHMPRLFVPISTGENKYMRPYTVLECQRIQGFPDNFEFLNSKENQIKQIGNAVPPIIITEVINYLNNNHTNTS